MRLRPGFAALCLGTLAFGLAGASCVDRLPDQDRRILSATAIAKMPVDDLFKDYQASKDDANRKYWGKAVEVTGRVATTRQDPTGPTVIFADKSGTQIVEAGLLQDQAAEIAAAVAGEPRITLKCYCDGLTSTRVVLKSCVHP